MKYTGDFEHLLELNYIRQPDNLYYFKTCGRYSAIFILVADRTIECTDIQAEQFLLEISEYIKNC